MNKYAIIVAGGSGSRMNSDIPKQFLALAGLPVLMHTLQVFNKADESIEIILSLPAQEINRWVDLCEIHDFKIPHQIVTGGSTRFHSVLNGLLAISSDEGLVAVHDGVRPLVSSELIKKTFKHAQLNGSAVTAVNLKDSIRKVSEEGKSKHQKRATYRLVQTPQAFILKDLKEAYANGFNKDFTDDASVYEALGKEVHLIAGEYGNIKITTPEDLIIAEALLRKEK